MASSRKSQNATKELLRLMLEAIKEREERGRRKREKNSNSITRILGEFRKFNPPSFKGTYDPTTAQEWINLVEKIFEVIEYSFEQKVFLAMFLF